MTTAGRLGVPRKSIRAKVARSGHLVLAEEGANLGKRCIKCGQLSPGGEMSQTFTYVPRLAYAALLLGLLPGALIMMLCQKKGSLTFAMCDEHYALRSRLIVATWSLSVLTFLAGCVGLGCMMSKKTATLNTGYAFLAVFGVSFIAAIIVGNKARTLSLTQFSDDGMKMGGAGEGFLKTLTA